MWENTLPLLRVLSSYSDVIVFEFSSSPTQQFNWAALSNRESVPEHIENLMG
jgi:hypothetical protein